MNEQSEQHSFWFAGFVLLIAILGYCLPWLQTVGTGLSSNGYDLAEWISLHPTVRATSDVLLPALLLRLSLVVVGLLSVARAKYGQGWILIAIAVWFALVPPVAFFLGEYVNTNYIQQLILWIIFSIGALIIFVARQFISRWMIIALSLTGLIGAVWGVISTVDLMGRYDIPVGFGVGSIIYILGLFVYTGLVWIENKAGSLKPPAL